MLCLLRILNRKAVTLSLQPKPQNLNSTYTFSVTADVNDVLAKWTENISTNRDQIK